MLRSRKVIIKNRRVKLPLKSMAGFTDQNFL